MSKEAAERYMEWLEREEEKKGIGYTQRATFDIEAMKAKLTEELKPHVPAESQIRGLMDWGKARYEILPEIGITTFKAPHYGGWHMGYYDLATKRFINYLEVRRRIMEYWAEWGY